MQTIHLLDHEFQRLLKHTQTMLSSCGGGRHQRGHECACDLQQAAQCQEYWWDDTFTRVLLQVQVQEHLAEQKEETVAGSLYT